MTVLSVQSEAKARENRRRNWKGSKSKERDRKDPGGRKCARWCSLEENPNLNAGWISWAPCPLSQFSGSLCQSKVCPKWELGPGSFLQAAEIDYWKRTVTASASFPVVVRRYMADKSNLREEGLIWLSIPGYSLSLCGRQGCGKDLLQAFPRHSQSGAESNDSGIQACQCSTPASTHKHQVPLPRKWRPYSGWVFSFQLI